MQRQSHPPRETLYKNEVESHREHGDWCEEEAFLNHTVKDACGGLRLVVTQGDLESVASLFGRTVALRRGHQWSPEQEKDAGILLDSRVRVVMQTMKKRLIDQHEGPLQDAEVVMAKHNLYSICFRELISLTDATNPDLSGVLETLRGAHEKILRHVPGIVRRAIGSHAQEVSGLQEGKKRDAEEGAELIEAAQSLEKEAVTHHRELERLRRRLKALEEENIFLKEKDTGHPSLVIPPTPPRKPISDLFSTRGGTYCIQADAANRSTSLCEALEKEKTVEEPPPESARPVGFVGGDASCVSSPAKRQASAAVLMPIESTRDLSLKQLKDFIAAVHISKGKHDRRCSDQRLPSQTLARHLDDFLVHRYGLTLMARAQSAALRKGIKSFREESNAVKIFEMTLRNEIDEHFREQQQKLERDVVDLMRGRIKERLVRHHKKNGREDGRSNRRRRLGSSINKINNCIPQERGTFAAFSAATIDYLLRNQTRTDAPLTTVDWQSMVKRIYGEFTADTQTIGVLVKKAASCRGEEGRDNGDGASGRGGGREAGAGGDFVSYGGFLQVLLGYQLHGHLHRLRFFKKDFREVDIDADGALNHAQFLTLAKRTLKRAQQANLAHRSTLQRNTCKVDRGQTGRHFADSRRQQDDIEKQAAAHLKAADPNGFGGITFSECVQHLARSIEEGAGRHKSP